MNRRPAPWPTTGLLLRVCAGLVLWLALVGVARAGAGRPVIVPAREGEVLDLLQPHALGDEVAPGWTLHSVQIDQGTIHVWLAGPDETFGHVTLDHPDHAPDDVRATPSFAAAIVASPPGSEAAVEALLAAIARNDDGTFWSRQPATTDELGAGSRIASNANAWLRDGLVSLAGLALVALVLLVRQLRTCPRWMVGALAAITALGVVLRLAIPIEVAMAPWPYTRALLPAWLVAQGPALSLLHPEPIWVTDVIMNTVWGVGLFAPIAVYVHARYLLVDPRAALVVAGVMAVLPLHLRFSHSDAAFIPSITMSSIAFALVHAAIRERGGWALGLGVVAVPLVVAMTYLVRPLNLVYFPLFIATAFVDEGLSGAKDPPTRRRIALVAVAICVATFGVGVPNLLENFGPQVREGLSWRTLTTAASVVLSPTYNALLNPRMTPPGLTLLAGFGAVELWRRGRRRLFAFIVAWLGTLLVAHAYVVPNVVNMQARYHLHLVVPFVLLAACGFEGLVTRVASRWRRVAVSATLAYLLASPWIHLGFIRDVDHNDMIEWQFVHAQRFVIPDQCTVLEYTGDNAGARFARVGAYVEDRYPRSRFVSITTGRDEGGDGLSAEARDVLREPGQCLYFYAGLPCFGMKPRELPVAEACEAVLGYQTPVEVAAIEFPSRPYDENLSAGLWGGEQIRLVLYRLEPRDRGRSQ